MSIRNLDALFKPRALAVVGAGKAGGAVGAVLARNLLAAGFGGPIMPIDGEGRAVGGVLSYARVEDLPTTPDLAVLAAPLAALPPLIDAFGARGTKAAVILSGPGVSRAAESAGVAAGWVEPLLAAARPHGMRLLGPGCLGVMVPRIGLNASTGHRQPRPGSLAFVAQSDAIIATVLDWATARGIGFSHLVALGAMADVDFGDMLDYLALAGEVHGILLHMEVVTSARKFMSAARAASRLKPVIIVKSGRFPAAAAAVASHAGALASADRVYDAAFRRAGMLRVYTIGDLFGAMETLGFGPPAGGDRLAILTNGGGVGIVAADALLAAGGRLAALSAPSRGALEQIVPAAEGPHNPLDLGDDAPAERYRQALSVLLRDEGADAVLVLHCPTATGDDGALPGAIIETAANRRRPVLTCWLGEEGAHAARRQFAEHRIPTYETPERAVRAFLHLVEYRRNQETLTQTPPSVPEVFTPDQGAVRRIFERVLAEDRAWLTEAETMAVLAAYGIPVVATRTAGDGRAAAEAAAALGGRVVLKILSPDIPHKNAVGGIALGLGSPAVVRDAAEAMLARVGAQRPDARLMGFAVQPMIERPGAVEVLLGVEEDPHFGPVILFGQGGVAAEIIDDTALALPPLNMHLACEAMRRTRIYGVLADGLGAAPAAIDELALAMLKVSQLVIDFAEVVELEINPLLADPFGILALDGRLRICARGEGAAKRLAVRPYPKTLEQRVTLPDGRTFLLRPVLPEDEPPFQRFFQKLSPDAVRLRFFAPKKELTHPLAARLTQIDYDREMAFVLAEPGTPGRSELFGVVHLSADPDRERAEFAIVVRTDMVGLGLGPLLMRKIIDYARASGVRELFGEVLRENTAMLKLCDVFGFARRPAPHDPTVIEVALPLQSSSPAR